MSDEVRYIEYDTGISFIVNFKTGQVYASDDIVATHVVEAIPTVIWEGKRYILLNELIKKTFCDCRKKECLMKKMVKKAKELMIRVLQDACDS